MSDIYIGIDNGLSGGLVAISGFNGKIIASCVMPTRGRAKGNEVCALAIFEWLCDMQTPFDRLTAILETPGKFSAGTQALTSMWDSYGATRAVLELKRIRHHRIPPQKWQKGILGNVAKGDTKPAALAKARQLWPEETWLATPRSKVPHMGLIDAALIAEYGRINKL